MQLVDFSKIIRFNKTHILTIKKVIDNENLKKENILGFHFRKFSYLKKRTCSFFGYII